MAESVGKLLKMASNKMIKDFDRYTRCYGLTSNQLIVIDYLYYHSDRPVYQGDIETTLLIQRSTASVLLNRMVKKGLIKRVNDEHDGRKKRLALTDLAGQVRQSTRGYLALEHQALKASLNDDEISQLVQLLNKLLSIGD